MLRLAGSGNTKNNGASGADINNYAGQIKSAIESKFYDASSYARQNLYAAHKTGTRWYVTGYQT